MFKKRYVLVLVLALVITLTFSTELAADKYGGTLTFATDATPPTLDWQSTTITATRHVTRNVQEGLVAFTQGHDVRPLLAKDWEISDDGLTWTFYLREGVKFHNGEEMTAADVVASVDRWRNVSPRSAEVEDIREVEKVDEYTINLHLEDRIGALLNVMAMPAGYLAIMPEEIAELPAGEIGADELIGTGPYKLVAYEADEYARLERFEDYHHAQEEEPDGFAGRRYAYLDEIVIEFIPEAGTRLSALEIGDVDLTQPVLPMEYDRLEAEEAIEMVTFPRWHLMYFFNTERYPFENRRFRQAVLKGMNMEEIMWSVGEREDLIEITSSPHPDPENVWYTEVGEPYFDQRDLEGAREILEEEGYDGEELILLSTREYDWAFNMAIPLYEQLKDIGFNVRLEVVDWPTLVDRRDDPDEFHIFTTAGGVVEDPVRIAQYYTDDYPGWGTSDRIKELFSEIGREEETERRAEIWEEIQIEMWEEAFKIKPGYTYEIKAFRDNIKGTSDYMVPFLWNKYIED